MNNKKRQLLIAELEPLEQAASHLKFSLARTRHLGGQVAWTEEELERLESLTSRFARLSDLLTQRVMRLVDEIELTPQGSLLDRIYRAEKRGWGESADDLIKIQELRNVIAHEYAADRLAVVFADVVALTPVLLAVVPRVIHYIKGLGARD